MIHYISNYAHTLDKELGKKFDSEFEKITNKTRKHKKYFKESYDIDLNILNVKKENERDDIAFLLFEVLAFEAKVISISHYQSEMDNEIESLIIKYFKKHNIKFDVKEYLAEWEKNYDINKLAFGDYVKIKIHYVGELLKQYDLNAVLIDGFSIKHNLIVLTNEEKEGLKKYFDRAYRHFLFEYTKFRNVDRNKKNKFKREKRQEEKSESLFDHSSELKNKMEEIQSNTIQKIEKTIKKRKLQNRLYDNSWNFIYVLFFSGIIYQLISQINK